MTKNLPKDFQSVIPSLNINGAARAIELYKKAFGAKEEYVVKMPDSDKIMHASIIIGNSRIFLADVNPQINNAPSVSTFYAYFDDVDAVFKQAAKAGLSELYPLKDMFWGDRTGCLKDAFGITWTVATHVRDVSPAEMEEGHKNFCKAA